MAEMGFNPVLHTTEARIEQLELVVANHPEVLVIGSVGRAAILGHELSIDRERRHQVRDIDITGINHVPRLTEEELSPFPVDIIFKKIIEVKPNESFASVKFDVRRPDIYVELPAAVFEPYYAPFGPLSIPTFHPDTMTHISEIFDTRRPKDRAHLRGFRVALKSVDYEPFPEHYFEPLKELHLMVSRDKQLKRERTIERLQALYGHYFPPGIRKIMNPYLIKVKRKAGLLGRETQANETV